MASLKVRLKQLNLKRIINSDSMLHENINVVLQIAKSTGVQS